jgi:hypothetical protein
VLDWDRCQSTSRKAGKRGRWSALVARGSAQSITGTNADWAPLPFVSLFRGPQRIEGACGAECPWVAAHACHALGLAPVLAPTRWCPGPVTPPAIQEHHIRPSNSRRGIACAVISMQRRPSLMRAGCQMRARRYSTLLEQASFSPPNAAAACLRDPEDAERPHILCFPLCISLLSRCLLMKLWYASPSLLTRIW